MAKDFTEWQRELKKSLKPVVLAKLSSEQRKTAIREWIALANNCI